MPFQRAAGILLHPTSLPSRGGIGDFGPAAYRFVDFLASARQGVWQVLPLGPLGYGNSPYSSTSAFAGNPLLISLERLAEHGWMDRTKIDPAKLDESAGSGPVEYEQVFAQKMPLLFEAAPELPAFCLGRCAPAIGKIPHRKCMVAGGLRPLRCAAGAAEASVLESMAARSCVS